MNVKHHEINPKLEKVLSKAKLKYDFIEDCLLIYGSIPIPIFSQVSRSFDKSANLSMSLQARSGATFVIGNSESLKRLENSDTFKKICRNHWQTVLNKANGNKDDQFYSKLPENVRQWFEAGNQGASSRTLMNMTLGKVLGFYDEDYMFYCPHDFYDFKRCLELVKMVPEVKDHFYLISQYSKRWAHIINHFDELTLIVKQAELNQINLQDISDAEKALLRVD